nr:uncharacterized protein LOC104647482 [Solanum lycopersicum]
MKNREFKTARPHDRGTSKGKFEIQDKPKFKKRFSNHVPSSLPKDNKDGVSNPKPQGGKVCDSSSESPNCAKCGKRHFVKCLMGSTDFVVCGNSEHLVRDCPMDKTQGRESNQFQTSGLNFDAPKKNRFYALKSRGYQEHYIDVVTGMLQVFSINVYALIDPRATLPFVTPLVVIKFDVLPDILVEPFSISTPVEQG